MQNIEELRESLLDNYLKMKAGEMGIKLGKELSNAAGKIISSAKVQIDEYNRLGVTTEIDFLKVEKK